MSQAHHSCLMAEGELWHSHDKRSASELVQDCSRLYTRFRMADVTSAACSYRMPLRSGTVSLVECLGAGRAWVTSDRLAE